jgi:Ca2+-binding EF-hand superfamily protein
MADSTTDKVYHELDCNHDGKVTTTEFVDEIMSISFAKMDANGDGKIERSEWEKTEKGAAADKSFAAIDTNKDGVLEKSEYLGDATAREVLKRIFSTVDPNHDGVLSVKEVPANQKKN